MGMQIVFTLQAHANGTAAYNAARALGLPISSALKLKKERGQPEWHVCILLYCTETSL